MSKKEINNNFKFIKANDLKGVSLLEAQFNNFEYKKHSHDEYSIGVTRKGVQSFICKGTSYDSAQNGIITFNPTDVHDGHSGLDTGLKYQMLYVDYDIMSQLAREMCGDKFNSVYFETVRYDNEVMMKLLELFAEIREQNNNKLEIQSKFYDAMGALMQRHGIFSKTPINIYQDNALVEKARKYIRENADKNISLYDIADTVSLSPYHFSRLFKKATLLSPHNYLNQCRVEIAKKDIEKNIPLSELALNAGFSDQSHMNRRFKEIYGLTPGQYKKALV